MAAPSAATGDAEKLWSLIRDIKVAMLTTTDEDGSLRSRPMWTAQTETFAGELWFFTKAGSPKMAEIAGRHEVNLAYAEPEDQNYVSVSGRAEIVRDRRKAEELWKEPMRAWFPQGLEDPELALLRVHVHHAEYWDSPSSAMVFLYGYAKAVTTGKEPKELGDTGRVEFD